MIYVLFVIILIVSNFLMYIYAIEKGVKLYEGTMDKVWKERMAARQTERMSKSYKDYRPRKED